MKNRKGLPQDMKTQKLKKGELVFWRKQHLLAIKWRSTRDVYCLSTKHQATASDVSIRARGGREEVTKPDVIIDYNMNKTGVDRVDQLSSYYPFCRKTLKWWKKLFFHMFLIAVVNGWVVYREVTGKKVSMADFMRALGKQFADCGGVEQREDVNSRPATSADRTFGRHFPEKVPATVCKKKKCN